MRWAIVVGLALLLAGPALAQGTTTRKATPSPAPAAPVQQGSGEVQTLNTYTENKGQFVLRLFNPLGLPDPLCITDHPSGACGTKPGTSSTGGLKMTGNPSNDLADFFSRGGIVFIRDMMRADQYLSYPCKPDASNTDAATGNAGCNKTDLLGSSCLEAIIPVAKMVVNGPPVIATTTSAAATSTAATSPAQPAASTAGDSAPTPATTPMRTSTDTPPPDKFDEGVITDLAKKAIILNALQGTQLEQGCGGFIQQKIKSVISLGAGIMTFVTTLGLGGA